MLLRIAALAALSCHAIVTADAAGTTPPQYALAPPGQGENGDWAYFSRYRGENAALKPVANRVVFMGDSITEVWAREPLFAEHPNFVGRGLSGQTTPQMLVRFRADVIDLKPICHRLSASMGITRVAVVLAGMMARSVNWSPAIFQSLTIVPYGET